MTDIYRHIDLGELVRSTIFFTAVAILIAIDFAPPPWADIPLPVRVAYIALSSVMLLGPVKVVPNLRIMQMLGSIVVFLGIWTYVIQMASLYELAAFVAIGTIAIASTLLWPEYFD